MSNIFRKFWEGLSLKPRTVSAADEMGDLEVIVGTGKVQYHNGTTVSPIVTADHSETLKNKTLDTTNAITVKDTSLNVVDASDPTIIIKLDAAGTTGTSTTLLSSQTTDKILTLPNATDTLVARETTEELKNKTIDGDLNTIQDVGISSLKTVLADANKFIARDAAGAVVSLASMPASTIANTPFGNISSTDQQSVNNELQSDIDSRASDSNTVHKTGNESIAGIKTLTDSTQSTTKDDGCLVLDGGLGVERNVNIGGDVVITGGLQVNGTTTFVNTTNLDIKDANIVLNKGGNKAAADAGDAGFTVEVSDGVNAVIGYDSTLTSRFAIGEVGSLKEIVDVSSIQTLTNKKLSDTTTSFVDSVDPTKSVVIDVAGTTGKKTTILSSQTVDRTLTLPDATDTLVGKATTDTLTNKSLSDSTSFIVDASDPTIKIGFNAAGTTGKVLTLTSSQTVDRTLTFPDKTDTLAVVTDVSTHAGLTTTHGVSGSIVGTSDAQVLTNKDIDGGTAANTRRITIPQDTLAGITALARKEGTVLYGNDTNKLYVDDGATLSAVGAGGAGDPSVYVTLKSDEDSIAWSTGNNASFLGGGSLAGTFTQQNATTPLNGTYSYTLVQAAGSLNDYVASAVQAVPIRSRGVTNRTNLVYTYDGNDNDIKWIVYDVTNTRIVTPSTAYVVTSSVGKQVELVYDLPSTCTQVQFGLQVLAANNGKTLKFDDVQMSDQPFTTANLVINEAITYTGYTSKNGSNFVKFKTKNTTLSNNSKVLSDDNSGTFTKYNVLINCNVVLTAETNGTGDGNISIQHYNSSGTLIWEEIQTTRNFNGTASMTAKASAGDYFQVYTTATSLDVASTNFSITASSISSNIIQTWADGSEWKTLTYTEVNALTGNQGLGTFTAGGVEWMRGKDGLLHYKGKLTLGTVTASEARIPYPAGLIAADTTKIPSLQVSGAMAYNVNLAGSLVSLVEPSVGYFTIGMSYASAAGLTKENGNIFSSGNTISFNFTVPIQGWSSSPTILALPQSKENRFEARIAAAGTVTSVNTDFINSVTLSDTSLYTIDITKMGLTAIPSVTANISGFTQTQAVTGAKEVLIQSVTTTQIVIRTAGVASTSSTIGAFIAYDFTLKVSKQSPDYTAPGVFVGNIQPDYQYPLTVTGTNWTTVRAVGVPYKTGDGSYRMKVNINGTTTSQTTNTLTITGVVFKNITNFYQSLCIGGDANTNYRGYCSPNAATLVVQSGANVLDWRISGDVELESKPSWATFLP